MDRDRPLLTGTIGVIALAAGLEGYFIRVARPWERAIFIVAAICLIDPTLVTDLVGLGLLALGLGLQKLRPAAVIMVARSVS